MKSMNSGGLPVARIAQVFCVLRHGDCRSFGFRIVIERGMDLDEGQGCWYSSLYDERCMFPEFVD